MSRCPSLLLGYGIIAVPTGIVSVELARAERQGQGQGLRVCTQCQASGHDGDALYCKRCGSPLS